MCICIYTTCQRHPLNTRIHKFKSKQMEKINRLQTLIKRKLLWWDTKTAERKGCISLG